MGMPLFAKPKAQLPIAFADIFLPKRYKAFYGGRGSAKSHSVADALVIIAASRRVRILCCREIQKSIAESVKALLEVKMEAKGLLGSFFYATKTGIVGLNGSEFIFAGLRSNPTTIKSMEGIDICWVEEASTVSQTSIDILVPTIRADGSEIWFTWNPDKKTDPVDVMFRSKAGPPPDSLVRRVNWHDNPWFPKALRKEMLYDKKRDTDKYNFIWLGQYRRISEAAVFRNWRIESFDTEEIISRQHNHGRVVFLYGADWGFSVDPTVLVRGFIIGRTLYIDQEAYMVGCEIDATPHLFDTIEGSREWPIIADGARPETISYMQRHGYPKIKAARKGAGSVEEGVEFVKSFDVVIHTRCKNTAYEFGAYSYKVDKQTSEVLPILEDDHNHVIDAVRYALEGTRRESKAIVGTITGLS